MRVKLIIANVYINGKEYSNYHTTVLISHASKVMLKNPQTNKL